MQRKQMDRAGENKKEDTLGKQAGLSMRVIEDAKNGVCKIELSNENRGTGFFGTLDTGERVHRGLFTCNHLIDRNYLKSSKCEYSISNAAGTLKLRVQSFWFTDEDMDATFIELTDEQADKVIDMNFRFLVFNYSIKESDKLFLLQHPRGGDLRFAPGTVDRESRDGNMFYHNCDTDDGSSGSPVTNKNGEVLGIHCGVTKHGRKYAVKIKAVRKAVMEKLAPSNSSDTGLREMKQQIQQILQLQMQDKQGRERSEPVEQDGSASASRRVSRKIPGAQTDIQSDLIFCFGGYKSSDLTNDSDMLAYVPTNNKWYNVDTQTHGSFGEAAVNWNNTVVIVGSGIEEDCVEQYDPQRNTFESLPNLLYGRLYFALVNLNETLYVIGGADSDLAECVSNVEKFEKDTNKWQTVLHLNTPRRSFTASALQDCILVAGGIDQSDRYSRSCELYDSKLKQWSPIAPLNKPRAVHAAATFENTVYVFGGASSGAEFHNDAEQYNRRNDKWALLEKQMSVARCRLAAAIVGNAVYLLGGCTTDEFTDLVECYDFETKEFTLREPLPSARYGFAAVGVRVSSATLASLTQ